MKIASIRLRESQLLCSVPHVGDAAATLGARIRALREQAGLQSRELADQLGIDPSAMSNIERGKRSVKTDELTLIAEALGVSPLAILDESSLLARLPVAPRTEAAATVEALPFERLRGLAELHEVLADAGIPAQPLLDNVPTADPERWLESAEMLAEWATKHLEVQAHGDETFSGLIEGIEEHLRVDVLVDEHTGEALAGAAITDRAFPLIFVNALQPRPRALFTLAHELAHVLVGDGDALTLDFDLTARDERERLANAFAASYLMPAQAIEAAIDEHGRTATALAQMVDRLGVSFESLVYRLHNLKFINAEGRDQLRTYGLRGVLDQVEDKELVGRLLRRLGTQPERRPPTWLVRRSYEGYRRGVVSIRPLAGLLEIDPDELIEGLAQLEEGVQVVGHTFPEAGDELSDDELFSGNPV